MTMKLIPVRCNRTSYKAGNLSLSKEALTNMIKDHNSTMLYCFNSNKASSDPIRLSSR